MSFRFPSSGVVWTFKTPRFLINLEVHRDRNYVYDGDDEDGETQDKLDSGDFAAFDSAVVVYLDGDEIARNDLGGSVYSYDDVPDFWRGHRDPDPLNRNCSIMREARGNNTCIGHYFPDMVREAVAEARDYVRNMAVPPRMRGK